MDRLIDQNVNPTLDAHCWTMDIEPQRNLLDLGLGSGDLWHYELIVEIFEDNKS